MPERLVHRYYDPTTGQFLTVDPDLQETQQAYAYAGDDPVDVDDPSGDAPYPPQVFAAATYDPKKPYNVGDGTYLVYLTPQSINHVVAQGHLVQFAAYFTKFWGSIPTPGTIWQAFMAGTAATLAQPWGIVRQTQRNPISYLYQAPFFYSRDGKSLTLQFYVAVNEDNEWINTIYVSNKASKIGNPRKQSGSAASVPCI
ncbi:MAG TPA: RHS repeat-associated core domain-containing protein [Acidimicrobiales bacterium]|nr:RHS repeat-associated core domain-containing protein [Acidimicrobiales bacterium]